MLSITAAGQTMFGDDNAAMFALEAFDDLGESVLHVGQREMLGC